MKLIIDIPEEEYKKIKACTAPMTWTEHLIKNGTPLDKHDEEVIAETVESIWGKPPYMDILDKIRADIDIARFIDKDTKLCKNANASGLEVALQIIDKYKGEVDCHECKAEYECYYCKKYAESEET